jgi:hypothetical protein
LVGPDAPAASASLWRTAGERITHKLKAADGTAVIDAGRLRSPVPIVTASDLLIVLVSPVAEQLVALTHVLPTVREAIRGQISVVLVGRGPYRKSEIEGSLDVTVLTELPDDRDAANVLCHGVGSRSRLARSHLVRAVTELGAAVSTSLPGQVEVTAS